MNINICSDFWNCPHDIVFFPIVILWGTIENVLSLIVARHNMVWLYWDFTWVEIQNPQQLCWRKSDGCWTGYCLQLQGTWSRKIDKSVITSTPKVCSLTDAQTIWDAQLWRGCWGLRKGGWIIGKVVGWLSNVVGGLQWQHLYQFYTFSKEYVLVTLREKPSIPPKITMLYLLVNTKL